MAQCWTGDLKEAPINREVVSFPQDVSLVERLGMQSQQRKTEEDDRGGDKLGEEHVVR